MKVIKASFEILTATPDLEKIIELSGRTCYKSEDKITETSAEQFVAKIRSINHESVLEHGAITVRFITDRGVTHELVRHRVASFSQESTRYCNYSKDKFGSEITVIEPCFWDEEKNPHEYSSWFNTCLAIEETYNYLIQLGTKAQEARSVLPNSLKTEIVMTANPREWRHVFKLRCAEAAHPQIREIMIPCRNEFARRWPALFADLIE